MSIRRPLLFALAALAALPAVAQADPVTIDGSPLNVTMDELGRLQARFDNSPTETGEFYPPGSPVANAGFHLSIYDTDGSATLYGPAGGGGEPLDSNEDGQPDGPVLMPPGPGDSTQRMTTTWFAGPARELRVDLVLEYRNGDRQFTVRQTVTNVSGAPVQFTTAEYADLYLGGSDSGFGFLEGGPPRVVGGVNQSTTGGGIVEMTPPWSAYEANNLGTVSSHLANATGPAFDNTVSSELSDNAVGVQWDTYKTNGLAPGASFVFHLGWLFDEFEVPLPPPVPFINVNVDPEGVVRVKPPPGQTIPPTGSPGARAAQTGFVRITQPVQIPVGSIVDTRKGSIGMTSAANAQGATQNGDFKDGTFKILQRPAQRPVTELRMTGGNFSSCRRNVDRSSARTAARRIRRLSGNARGRFRTRGRNSSATVRGTSWTMADQCNGTLTRVRSGVVRVRDFAKNRTVTLRRGRSYLARPKRR